jgi:holin-like protein
MNHFVRQLCLPGRFRDAIFKLAQVMLLIVAYAALSAVLQGVGSTLNPALAGFTVLVCALSLKVVPVAGVERGANALISLAPLFLIPPVVAVAGQAELIEAHLLALAAIVVGGTVVCATVTSVAVEGATRLMLRELR